MSDADSPPEEAECFGCGEVNTPDGKQAAMRGGRLICVDCHSKKITYRAECSECDWQYSRRENLFQWYHVRQNVQMEANNHVTEKRVFEDETHRTSYELVGIDDGVVR